MIPPRRFPVFSGAILFSALTSEPILAESWVGTTGSVPGTGDFVTNIGGTFSGTNVANIVGADRFYSEGCTGQGTTSAVVEAGYVWSGHNSLGHVVNQANAASAEEVDRHGT